MLTTACNCVQCVHRFTRRMEKSIVKFRTPPQIRIALLRKGLTLRGFANRYGYKPSTVYAAARNERLGVVGWRVRQHLEEVAA